MSVYVDRLPKICCECVCNYDGWKCGINGEYIEHDGRREDCPLIEIVRCKDCKFCSVEETIRGIIPDMYCILWGSDVSTDTFCSYGKSKEEKQVTGKLESVEKAISESDESTMGQPKSKLESDLISRQAAIEAVEKAVFKGVAKSAIESLPPVEPPKKVVAQIKVDTDEIVKRIKEEYEIKDRPVCEDAISRADTIHAMCKECEKESGLNGECPVDCTEVAVVKSMPPVEPKRLPQPHKCVVYRDGSLCRHPIEACSECPKHEGMRALKSERPKGEWIFNPKDAIDSMFAKPKCNKCGFESADGGNFCPNCGADMKGADDETD